MDEMDRKRIQIIIEQVVAQERASIETVQREMQIAIDDALSKRHEPGHDAFISMFGDRCPGRRIHFENRCPQCYAGMT